MYADFSPNIRDVDLSYCAGLIDGEGCITIIKQKPKSNSPHYYVKITVLMTNERAIDKLCYLLGGKKYFSPPQKEGYKPRFVWTVAGRKCYLLLKHLQDYLVVKKLQCKLAIEFLEKTKGVPPKLMKDYMERSYWLMRELKKIE